MVTVMVLALTACGKDSGKKDNDKETGGPGAKVEDVETIYDAIGLATEYTKGDYKVEVSFDADVEDVKASGSVSMSGKLDGSDMTTGIGVDANVDGTAIKWSASDIITVADDKAYIDIDAIVEAISKVSTDAGSFAIPLPKKDMGISEETQKKAKDFSDGLLKAALGDIEVKKDGNTFTVEVKEAEQYISFMTGTVDYLINNKDAFNEIINSSSSVDVKEYFNTLVEYYRDDIKKLGNKLDTEITDEMIDAMVEQYSSQLDSMTDVGDVDVFEDADLEGLKEQLESIDAAELQKEIDEAGMALKFSITADADKYVVDGNFAMEMDGEKMSMSIKYTFEADSSVSVKAPSDVATITSVYEYVESNPDKLQEILQGMQELMGDLGLE